MKRASRNRSFLSPTPLQLVGSYVMLAFWALVVLFPIYWLVVTSLKTPAQVDQGPFYLPGVDYKPTLENWHYLLVEVGGEVFEERRQLEALFQAFLAQLHVAHPRVQP